MTTKIVRGQVLVFEAQPKDHNGVPVRPLSMELYLNYKHADGTTKTDPPIAMERQTDGSWLGSFDTQIAEDGAGFASIRSVGPGGAEDFKFSIVANVANPDPA
jgi:hypothetical protein